MRLCHQPVDQQCTVFTYLTREAWVTLVWNKPWTVAKARLKLFVSVDLNKRRHVHWLHSPKQKTKPKALFLIPHILKVRLNF